MCRVSEHLFFDIFTELVRRIFEKLWRGITVNIRVFECTRCRDQTRRTGLVMLIVYNGTAWAISRIKPSDAWLVSLCPRLCVSICTRRRIRSGTHECYQNRRRKYADLLRKGNSVTSLFHQFSLLDQKHTHARARAHTLSLSRDLFHSLTVHRIRCETHEILVRPPPPSLGSCIYASSDSILSSCDIARYSQSDLKI